MENTNNTPSEQVGSNTNNESISCLFANSVTFNVTFNRTEFEKKFGAVKTGVTYKAESESFKVFVKNKNGMEITEEVKFEHSKDGKYYSYSYKELFGKVASVGQSYFSDGDFGKILSTLYNEQKKGFELEIEKINAIVSYFSGKKKVKDEDKKNGKTSKRYATPKAATCKLLMVLFPDKFCPIPTPDKVDKLIKYLSDDEFINVKLDKKKINDDNWLLKWCVYNNLLFQIFKPHSNDNSNQIAKADLDDAIEPWEALIKYEQKKKQEKLITLLSENHNIILTGAPGTGKTFRAKQIAVEMTRKNSELEHKPEKTKGIQEGEASSSSHDDDEFVQFKKNGWVDFVQFHPSYDYTDFVEGLRPKESMDGFERKDGVFKAFCANAAIADHNKPNDEKRKFIFIIDEINRGEISKIFGELFFSIDPDYRGKKGIVKTQYQNLIKNNEKLEVASGVDKDDEHTGGEKATEEAAAAEASDETAKDSQKDYPFIDGFYVPNNVYIIGTMNDIDRSVESMDFAFRRRFAFYEITAEDSKSMLWDGDNYKVLEDVMDRVNKELVKPEYGLSKAYQIGASYFNKIKQTNGDNDYNYSEELKKLWKYRIEGLLYEYLRGKPNAVELLEQLKKAYYGQEPVEEEE